MPYSFVPTCWSPRLDNVFNSLSRYLEDYVGGGGGGEICLSIFQVKVQGQGETNFAHVDIKACIL